MAGRSCSPTTANGSCKTNEADPDDGVDFFFDVPVNIAWELTGYRHDEGDHTYEVLEPVPRKGWVARLLGAR